MVHLNKHNQILAYCIKCKEKTPLHEPHVHHNAKGGVYAKGDCSICGKKSNVVALPKAYLNHIPEKDREHLKQGGFLPLLLAAIPAIAAAASGIAGIVNSTRATNAQIDALKGAQGQGFEAPAVIAALAADAVKKASGKGLRKKHRDIVPVNHMSAEPDILKALHSHMHSAKAFHKEYKNLKSTLKGCGLFLPSGRGLYLN